MSPEIVGIYTKKKFCVYLKSKFNWVSCILFYGNNVTPIPSPKSGDVYTKLITHCIALALVITSGWLYYSLQDEERGTSGFVWELFEGTLSFLLKWVL